jgi:hypothetical protein
LDPYLERLDSPSANIVPYELPAFQRRHNCERAAVYLDLVDCLPTASLHVDRYLTSIIRTLPGTVDHITQQSNDTLTATMGFVSFTLSYIFFSVVHIVGLALALTVCGLYGRDLHNANDQDKYADSKWVSSCDLHVSDGSASVWLTRSPLLQVYAVVVGGISAVTCVLYLVPFILRVAGIVIPVWNFILFILWIAVFGVFGSVCTPTDQVAH